MAPQKQVTPVAASKITYKTTASFSTVDSRLTASIRGGSGFSEWPGLMKNIIPSPSGRADFIAAVERVLGPHGFMEFYLVNHGSWLPIYAPPTAMSKVDGQPLQAKRYVLGNPLIAITMIEHDLDAGLFAPVELVVVDDAESEGGKGCKIVYMLPSGLVAGYEGASKKLKEAAEKLDEKLEAFIQDITRD